MSTRVNGAEYRAFVDVRASVEMPRVSQRIWVDQWCLSKNLMRDLDEREQHTRLGDLSVSADPYLAYFRPRLPFSFFQLNPRSVLFIEPLSGRFPSISVVVWIKTGGAELVLLSSLDWYQFGVVDRRVGGAWDRGVVPERSNAIIGVVTDKFVVSEYHRAMMVNLSGQN
ncbi:leucine-rich repeat containing protein [Dorcoceras hygrometricum]|uniref:Leucine-rich repeat containing protein n=1 Tax=Dorcoceras hygrometricum TaxID=472368 RepID=A0A2Z7BT13_9LAMI|nr:leucine-rich repeat containing protein [Dorcoceras hygrometricum]